MAGAREKIKPYPIATLENVIRRPMDDLFGIVSDTHFGSKYSALNELNEIYDYFQERGIKDVYHAGDLIDGFEMYRGQFNDQNKIGYEEQANFSIKQYPKRKNMKTFIVMGNHDASYMKRQGSDIVKYVCAYRPDLEYVGIYFARFIDRDKGTKMDLVHPSGSIPYAVSYGTQKYLRNRPPSYHPDILIQGHRHLSWYGYYQEVHSIEAGCFIEPTDFLVRQGCAGNIGGWVVEMERSKKHIKKLKTEWITYE